VLPAKPQARLFEGANPRHAHEWAAFKDVKLPEERILIPGGFGAAGRTSRT
jgi:5-methyltetrahydropteroyltriglutamate--homocysteine methyltransferase